MEENKMDLSQILKDVNVLDIVEERCRKIIQDKLNDQWFFETSKKKLEDFKKRILLKTSDIEILENKNLQLQQSLSELYENQKKIFDDVTNIEMRQETCNSHFEQLKKAVKICLLLSEKLDRVNSELVNDIDKFNTEIRKKEAIYTNEIEHYQSLIHQQEDEGKRQFEEYKVKFEQLGLESEELDKEKLKMIEETSELEKHIQELYVDAENAIAQKCEVEKKNSDLKDKIENKEKETALKKEQFEENLENLRKDLHVITSSYTENKDLQEKAQLKLDIQNETLKSVKEKNVEVEKTASALEEEYKDFENEVQNLYKHKQVALDGFHLTQREYEKKKNELEAERLEMKELGAKLCAKLESLKISIEKASTNVSNIKQNYKDIEDKLNKENQLIETIKATNLDTLKEITLRLDEESAMDEQEEKINLLKQTKESKNAQLLEVNNKIEKLKLDNCCVNDDVRKTLENEIFKLEEDLKNMEAKIKQASSDAQDKMRKLHESSAKEIKEVRDSVKMYKAEQENRHKKEEQELIEKKKLLTTALKSKQIQIDDLRTAINCTRNEIQIVAGQLKNITFASVKSEQMEKFLKDSHLNTSKISEDDDILNITPIHTLPKRQSAKNAQKNWKNLWSGSTSDEMFSQKKRPNDSFEDLNTESPDSPDSDLEMTPKKRKVTRKPKAKAAPKGKNKK